MARTRKQASKPNRQAPLLGAGMSSRAAEEAQVEDSEERNKDNSSTEDNMLETEMKPVEESDADNATTEKILDNSDESLLENGVNGVVVAEIIHGAEAPESTDATTLWTEPSKEYLVSAGDNPTDIFESDPTDIERRQERSGQTIIGASIFDAEGNVIEGEAECVHVNESRMNCQTESQTVDKKQKVPIEAVIKGRSDDAEKELKKLQERVEQEMQGMLAAEETKFREHFMKTVWNEKMSQLEKTLEEMVCQATDKKQQENIDRMNMIESELNIELEVQIEELRQINVKKLNEVKNRTIDDISAASVSQPLELKSLSVSDCLSFLASHEFEDIRSDENLFKDLKRFVEHIKQQAPDILPGSSDDIELKSKVADLEKKNSELKEKQLVMLRKTKQIDTAQKNEITELKNRQTEHQKQKDLYLLEVQSLTVRLESLDTKNRELVNQVDELTRSMAELEASKCDASSVKNTSHLPILGYLRSPSASSVFVLRGNSAADWWLREQARNVIKMTVSSSSSLLLANEMSNSPVHVLADDGDNQMVELAVEKVLLSATDCPLSATSNGPSSPLAFLSGGVQLRCFDILLDENILQIKSIVKRMTEKERDQIKRTDMLAHEYAEYKRHSESRIEKLKTLNLDDSRTSDDKYRQECEKLGSKLLEVEKSAKEMAFHLRSQLEKLESKNEGLKTENEKLQTKMIQISNNNSQSQTVNPGLDFLSKSKLESSQNESSQAKQELAGLRMQLSNILTKHESLIRERDMKIRELENLLLDTTTQIASADDKGNSSSIKTDSKTKAHSLDFPSSPSLTKYQDQESHNDQNKESGHQGQGLKDQDSNKVVDRLSPWLSNGTSSEQPESFDRWIGTEDLSEKHSPRMDDQTGVDDLEPKILSWNNIRGRSKPEENIRITLQQMLHYKTKYENAVAELHETKSNAALAAMNKDPRQMQYLKNVLVNFLKSAPEGAQEHETLMPVLFRLLGLTPSEIDLIQSSRPFSKSWLRR